MIISLRKKGKCLIPRIRCRMSYLKVYNLILGFNCYSWLISFAFLGHFLLKLNGYMWYNYAGILKLIA